MQDQQEIQLSSNWTNVGVYVTLVFCLIFIPLFYPLVKQTTEIHIGIVIAGIVILALTGFSLYQLIYSCDARIINDKLVLKKKFRPAKAYSFDKIGYPSSFRLKQTKYITVEMENDDRSFEKYLIINSHHLFSFEKKDAESLLISLWSIEREKK